MLGHEVHQIAGLDLADAVGGDTSGQLHLAAVHRGQHDRGRLELVLELVQCVAQHLGICAFQGGSQHLDALDLQGLRQQFIALRRGELALEGGDLLLEGTHLIQHGRCTGGHIGRAHLHGTGGIGQGGLELLQVGQSLLATHRFHPANPRGHAAFGHHLEQADVTGALHMGATTQFARTADVQHPHRVAVLLTEQHHRANLLGLFDRHHTRLSSRVQ